MPRSMWRGAISFGMVAIPVRLYLATESKSISFRLLCPDDHTPVKNKRWCPTEDREIGWNQAVRGFEVSKDEYIELNDDELDTLPLKSSHTIEILEFCHDDEIEPGVYLKSAYYLEPEAVGVKPYYLLKNALKETGKVAVGKIALRDREHLCRLALHDSGLLLNTLHWPDEIRTMNELKLPEDSVEINKRELAMAKMLIENLSATFDPERYRDEYRDAVLELVEAKRNQQPLRMAPSVEAEPVADLMAALKASVEASQGRADASPKSAAGAPTNGRTATAARATAAKKRAAAPEPAKRRKAS